MLTIRDPEKCDFSKADGPETLCQVCVHFRDKQCHDSLCRCSDRYWRERQPDNGLGDRQWGEEDCVHIESGVNAKLSWNDLRCDHSLQWICAKMP